MSKKVPLILTLGVLGLLSAGAMWLVPGRMSNMMNTSTIGIREGEMMGSWQQAEPEMMMGRTDSVTVDRGMGMGVMYPYPYGDDALSVQERSIQKYAYHSLVVQNVSEYMNTMRQYFESVGGVVLSYSQGTSNYGYEYGNLSIKVPVSHFDEAVKKTTENVTKVVSASVEAQDITGTVVSVADQIQQLEDQKSEQQIYLDDAATTVEKKKYQLEIDRIDRQIAQLQKSQEVIEDRVDYATLNITVANREYYFTGNGPRPLGDVIQQAWYSLHSTGFGILYFLIWVAVYAIIWIPVLLLARWLWGKVRPTVPKTTSK